MSLFAVNTCLPIAKKFECNEHMIAKGRDGAGRGARACVLGFGLHLQMWLVRVETRGVGVMR